LLALADIHHAFSRVTEILDRVGPVDAIVLAGDLTTNGTPEDVEQAIALWRPRAAHLLAVSGNMDSPAIDRVLEKLGVSLDGRCARVDDVAFHGCSAAPLSVGTPYEIPEAEITARLERGHVAADGAARRVVVPHAPPHGTLDRTWIGTHAGSHAVGDFIRRTQPLLVLCGHIHEARGQDRIGETLVVNCGPARRGHYVIAQLDERGCDVQLH
jgi:hypothetical protein